MDTTGESNNQQQQNPDNKSPNQHSNQEQMQPEGQNNQQGGNQQGGFQQQFSNNPYHQGGSPPLNFQQQDHNNPNFNNQMNQPYPGPPPNQYNQQGYSPNFQNQQNQQYSSPNMSPPPQFSPPNYGYQGGGGGPGPQYQQGPPNYNPNFDQQQQQQQQFPQQQYQPEPTVPNKESDNYQQNSFDLEKAYSHLAEQENVKPKEKVEGQIFIKNNELTTHFKYRKEVFDKVYADLKDHDKAVCYSNLWYNINLLGNKYSEKLEKLAEKYAPDDWAPPHLEGHDAQSFRTPGFNKHGDGGGRGGRGGRGRGLGGGSRYKYDYR